MFSFFPSNKKPYQAQVNSTDTVLEVAAGDNLLNAALSSGLAWPHNCRVGSCGTCRCRLVSGKIKPLNDFSYVLDDDELDRGMILACQTRLRSDIEVQVNLEASAKTLSKPQTVSGIISRSVALTHDILELRIQLEQDLPPYIAGQYADISVADIAHPRSYSFACAPELEESGTVTFFVRKVHGGEMSAWLHDKSQVGERVTVSGPHGTFYLREAESPVLCIAGGSGLAPIKALLEQLVLDGFNRSVTFLFGARTQQDLYCLEQMHSIRDSSQGRFRFTPILSHEADNSDWNGARGMVTEFITEQGLDISSCQAYLCGPPPMIDSAIAVFSEAGLKLDQIFFDKFLDASHLPGGNRSTPIVSE